jgi:hypothetical protein
MQRHHLIERDLAASLLVVKHLKDPFPVASERPRPIAVVGRKGSAGKADNLAHVAPGLTQPPHIGTPGRLGNIRRAA